MEEFAHQRPSRFPVPTKILSVVIKLAVRYLGNQLGESNTWLPQEPFEASCLTARLKAIGYLLSFYDENKTDIVLCSYDDHFLVMVTQMGSMGTILNARKEGNALTSQTFNVSVIFGKRDEPLLVACARQLIQHISDCGSSRPLILSLGLKDHSPDTLKHVVSVVNENRIW